MDSEPIKIERCQVCDRLINNVNASCEHFKNGYCQIFLFQAEKDQQEFNMHTAAFKKAP